MKFHDSLQFPRLNAKQNNGPILHFALRKLEKLNQGNFLSLPPLLTLPLSLMTFSKGGGKERNFE